MAEKEKPKKSEKELKEEHESKQKSYLSDLKTFAYGGVAGKFLMNEDLDGSQISLEKLASDMKIDKDSKLAGFLQGTYASEKGIQTASTVYANIYQTSIGKSTIGNLWSFYGESAKKYLGDLKSKADEEIAKIAGTEYEKIRDKYLAAQEIFKSKTNNFSKEQKENAEKDMKKYAKAVNTLEIMNKLFLRPYENNVEQEKDVRLLKSLYEEPKK